MARKCIWVLLALLLAACSSPSQKKVSRAVQADVPKSHPMLPPELIGEDRQQQQALQTFVRSCARLGAGWQSLCSQAKLTPDTNEAAARFFASNFDEYTLDPGSGL